MEPLDPARNEEDRRFSSRRISSILKAPRRSVRFPDSPEQEYVVECAKPVEKRTSRRVSFAPANDVLLFSKDGKNGSPVRNPLQELMTSTSAATQNRVQVAVSEDEIQPIIGMETLLNAPLHASQQRDTANFDTGYDMGEKTLVFSTDDAFLDMTQSHTINIDAGLVDDISFENYDALPAKGQRRVMLTASDGTMDLTPGHNVVIGGVSVLTSRNMDAGAPKGNISSAPILDPGFENFLANFSKPSESGMNPVIAPMTPAASSDRTDRSVAHVKTHKADVDKENQAQSSVSFAMEKSQSTSRKSGGLSHGRALCPEDDSSTDMNAAQAGGLLGFTEDDDAFQCLFPTQEMYSQVNNRALQTEEETHQQQISKPQASHNPKEMTSLRNQSVRDFSQRHMDNLDTADQCREKTCIENVRLPVNKPVPETCGQPRNSSASSHRAVTRTTPTAAQPPPTGDSVNGGTTCAEEDVCIDMTEAQTGQNSRGTFTDDSVSCLFLTQDMCSLSGSLKKAEMSSWQESSMYKGEKNLPRAPLKTKAQHQFEPQVDFSPACGEKTVRFTASDATMDVTRSHTVHIASDFEPQSDQNMDFPPACGEKTVRFTASDATMDVTRSHTVHIASDFEPQSDQNVGFLPASKEQTIRFSSADAAMDMTQCLTLHFDHISASDSLPHRDSDILPTPENTNYPLMAEKVQLQRGNRSLKANAVDPGFFKSFSKKSGPMDNPVVTISMAPAALSPIKTVDTRGFLLQVKTLGPDVDTVKEAPSLVSAAVENSVDKTMMDEDVSMEMTNAQTGCIWGEKDEPPETSSEVLGATKPDGEEITNPHDSLRSNESGATSEQRHRTASLLNKTENSRSAVDGDVGSAPSQKSRRKSLADLQSKVRRLSHIIHSAPVDFALGAYTAPLPPLENDKKTLDNTKHLPVEEPQLEMGSINAGEGTQAPTLMQGEQPFISTTPFNLKTKQLMSRLSVGSFKAKLPQRGKPEDPKEQITVEEPTRTLPVNVTDEYIFNEELVTYGDMSETLDLSLQGATEKGSASHEFLMDELIDDTVYELDFSGSIHGKKRPLPVDETNEEDKKRTKTSTEATASSEKLPMEECDGYIANAPSMTGQSTDYSISSTRCEATFESTLKQSMFDSQLEDYANDVQKKLNDGTITVLEFFKLFNIDFIINNPRHSNFPGRPFSDTDRTLMDLLKDRHIFRPQQMVYEADVLSLTEKVEGLKERMWDLEKPLKILNRALWEEMRNSSQEEFKSFGAKLKERNNFFRRMSKVQSDEMKEVLYSKLLQANREEQQRSRETLEEADEMLKSLDVCIQELETELIAIEDTGFEDKPSLKSLEEEMQKVAESLVDKDRQISELELQKTQNSKELKRLKVETGKLESHVSVLHMLNEWKLGEKTESGTTYMFLHETLHLELVYEEPSGNDASNQSERKISHITFKHQLDDEKSQGHAGLVHKLLSEFIEGEGDWAEKYPTSRHVPKLLHDVGLVVSRCRLLGEELRLLQMWGGLRLDILHISCLDTRVHIVFSSLKAFSKFEVIFSVSLVNHFYVLQVQSFKNVIGNVTIQQVEEIVSSFSPAKNLLTKIVKRIHEDLLC